MALTGKFLADFSAFYEAVQQAEISLRSFETGAGKVENSLNRMVDSFSGRKIISEAELAVRAVNDIGGAAKLTENEQRRLNGIVTEALAKYKALGYTVPPAMQALADATKKVEDATEHAGHAAMSLKDQYIQIFSGQATKGMHGLSTGIIEDANAVSAAVTHIGGASKLTQAEQAKVNKTVSEAVEKYRALGQQAPADMKALADATRKAAVETEKMSKSGGFFSDLTTQVKATALGFISAQAVIGAVTTGIRTLTEFIGSSVQAFAAQETAVRRMTTALQTQGTATPEVISQYKAMASQFQNTTVYADELVNEMQALLVQVGNVMPSQMEGALKASTDLASGLGIDLRTATILVGKAFEGETGTLKRYGVVIDEAKIKTQGVTAVLDGIHAKFGGQAQAEVETYAGKIKQLSNYWGELKEAIGGAIVQNPLLVAAMRNATEQTKHFTENTANAEEQTRRALQPFGLFGRAYLYIADMAKAANIEVANFNRAVANAPTMRLGSERPAQFGVDLPKADDIIQGWIKEGEAHKKAAASANQHAEAIRNLADRMSGADLVRQMHDLDEATSLLVRQHKLDADAKERVAAAAGKLLQAGTPLTRQLFDLAFAFGELNPKILEGAEGLEKIGEKAYLAIPPLNDVGALLPKVTVGIGDIVNILPKADLGYQFAQAKEPIKKAKDGIDELARALAQLSQISGGVFGGVVQDLGTLVAAADTAQKSISSIKDGFKGGFSLSGITDMASGILGLASAAISAGKALGNLFDRNKGRDLVNDFAGEHGGYDALHKELLQLGQEGEQLWINLTQGVGRNNPEQAKKAIQAIGDALANFKPPPTMAELAGASGFQTISELQAEADQAVKIYEYVRDSGLYSAETVQEAWQRSNDALIAAGDQSAAAVKKAQDQIDQLKEELNGFSASLQAEADAPEYDEMGNRIYGVVELQQMARKAEIEGQLEVLKQQQEAAEQAMKDTVGSATEAATTVATTIQDTFAAYDFVAKLRFEYDLPKNLTIQASVNTPDSTLPGFASGTAGRYLNFGAGTPVMLHGRERVMTEGEGGSAVTITVPVYLEGRQIAEATVPYIPDAVRRYGLA